MSDLLRKKPVQRAFTGLAGSPLSTTTEPQNTPVDDGTAPALVTLACQHVGGDDGGDDGGDEETPKADELNWRAIQARETRAKKTARRDEVKELSRLPPAERNRRIAARNAEQDRLKKLAEAGLKASEQEQARISKELQQTQRAANRLKNRMPQMSDGMTLKGRGEFISGGGAAERLSDAAERTDRFDHPEEGRQGRVVPRGTGQKFGGRRQEEDEVSENLDDIGDENFTIPKAASTFTVRGLGNKFNDIDETRMILDACVGVFEGGRLCSSVIRIVPDSERFQCRLCGFESADWADLRAHFENAVSDERRDYDKKSKRHKEVKEAWDEFLVDAQSEPVINVLPIGGQKPPDPGEHLVLFVEGRKFVRNTKNGPKR